MESFEMLAPQRSNDAEPKHNHMQTKTSMDGTSTMSSRDITKTPQAAHPGAGSALESLMMRLHGDGNRTCMDRRHLQCQTGRVQLVRVIRLRACLCLCQHPNCILRQRCLFPTQSRKHHTSLAMLKQLSLLTHTFFIENYSATACMSASTCPRALPRSAAVKLLMPTTSST